VRLHRTPEGVALQRPTRDGLVREPKFTKRELVAEQPIGIRLVGVVRAHMIDREATMSTWSYGRRPGAWTGTSLVVSVDRAANCSGRTTSTWATDSTHPRSSRSGSSKTCN
jgi:hypothetical protein